MVSRCPALLQNIGEWRTWRSTLVSPPQKGCLVACATKQLPTIKQTRRSYASNPILAVTFAPSKHAIYILHKYTINDIGKRGHMGARNITPAPRISCFLFLELPRCGCRLNFWAQIPANHAKYSIVSPAGCSCFLRRCVAYFLTLAPYVPSMRRRGQAKATLGGSTPKLENCNNGGIWQNG